MSNIAIVSEVLNVSRSDRAYMAHAYLTKVPVPAITAFIEAHTRPGDVVLDPFAGSGMTGVGAIMVGRRAELSDISVLGQHIGRNYVNLVDPGVFEKVASEVVDGVKAALDGIYEVTCSHCGEQGQLAKAVWSFLVECGTCYRAVNYYRALEAADWSKKDMACPHCSAFVSSRLQRVGDEPVVDYVVCACSKTQVEQPADTRGPAEVPNVDSPRVEIEAHRQMFIASALAKNKLTQVADFYSPRNLAVLTTLHQRINAVDDPQVDDVGAAQAPGLMHSRGVDV